MLSAQRNGLRLPAYSRLDLRADRTFTYRKSRLTLFIEVVNATNRDNYRPTASRHEHHHAARVRAAPRRLFPLLPVAGVLIEFYEFRRRCAPAVQQSLRRCRRGGSYTMLKNFPTGSYPQNPNLPGVEDRTTWNFKATGSYDAGWGIRISPVVRHQSGVNFARTLNVSVPRRIADCQRPRDANVGDASEDDSGRADRATSVHVEAASAAILARVYYRRIAASRG